MVTKLCFVVGLCLLTLSGAASGLIRVDTLRPAVGVDSVRVSRLELAKLELARRTLLSLDFTVTDSLIDVLSSRVTLSEATTRNVVDLTRRHLRRQDDSLRVQAGQLRQVNKLLGLADRRAARAEGLLVNLTADLKAVRRRLWWERLRAGGIGAAVALVVKSFF